MRIFEILLLAALFTRLVGYALPSIKESRWIDFVPSLAVLLTVMHLVLEGFRWQMIPAYGLTLFFFLRSLRCIKHGGRPPAKQPPRRIWIIAGFLARSLIFVLVASLPIIVPVFRLPDPTGPYPIGTTTLYLVDDQRPEIYTPAPDDHRELMVQVWYPAQKEPGARLAPLMEHMPFQFSYLSLVRTHAYQDAPMSAAQASYPVLIFSHGHVGFVEQNLTQMEELASHGYVVCSIAHPFHTIATVFPDRRVIPADSILANNLLQGNSPPQDVNAEHLQIWTEDTRFLIDELEDMQTGARESLFVGKLDMARLGIFGQSFGGVAAIQVCSVDDRCQAGINLDGGLPRGLDSALKQPFMFLVNEGAANYLSTNIAAIDNKAYGIAVRGATHFDFTDLFLYSPVLKFTKAFGPIDGFRMIKIINAYTLAFFDETLKDDTSSLLNGPSSDYPEVTIKIRDS